jgi:septal ring factor EnvC (AmiA/AmiB activator)
MSSACWNFFYKSAHAWGLCLLLLAGSAQANERLSEAEASLKSAEQNLAALFSQIDDLRRQQTNLIQVQKNNETEIARLDQRIEGHRQQLAQLIQMEAQWRLIPKPRFNPGEITPEENMRRYWITQLRENHYMLARSMQIMLADKQRIAQENQTKQAQILALIQQQENLSEGILDQIAQRKSILAKLKREEAYQQERLAAQSRSLATLSLPANTRANGPANYTRFSQLRGLLPHPTLGKVTRYPERKNSLFFEQNDSQPVFAVARGKVVYAEWINRIGHLIILDHGGDYISLYGHNRNLTREVNEWVEMGDVIAYSGNTGGLDEIGLLFEIRKAGEPLQVDAWLAN